MNSGLRNKTKPSAYERNAAKPVAGIMEDTKKFYRELASVSLSDSETNSTQDSACRNLDDQTSFADCQGCEHNCRAEIAEQLSKLKIGYNNENEYLCDPVTVDDSTSSLNDLEHDSILAGSPFADNYCNSIPTPPECVERYSSILAGRLQRKDSVVVLNNDQSILNTAINESVETSCAKRFDNSEILQLEDSLEVQSKKVTYLIDGAFCNNNKLNTPRKEHSLRINNENLDPDLLEPKKHGGPRIVSNEKVNLPLDKLNLRPASPTSKFQDSVLKDRNDNIAENSTCLSRSKYEYGSSSNDSEKIVVADIKTPNYKAILFIEDCCKSSPMMEVNGDTFGSAFITDISNLSALGIGNDQPGADEIEKDHCRSKIIERLSQQFMEAPLTFTEKLVTLLEQSLQVHDKVENTETSGANFSRLTEEFRKICQDYGPQIEDQSECPDLYFTISNNSENRFSQGESTMNEGTPVSPLKNFCKLGGGKKVYRTTPRRVDRTNNGMQCRTPNCANALHRVKKNIQDRSDFSSPGRALDNTANFEFWENLCYGLSPNKHTKLKLSKPEIPGIVTHEDLMRKSDQQMASLNTSIQKSESGDTNSTTTSKDCQDHSNLTRQKFIENLSNQKINNYNSSYNEIEEILSAGIVQKRRKCFEEAVKVFEANQSIARNKNEVSVENKESYKGGDNQARFFSTLSACVDYFDHVKTLQNYRHSLNCIMECSEDSESSKQNTDNSVPSEYVQALILPVKKQARYQIENFELLQLQPTPNRPKLVAETCLYLPGTPAASPKTPNKTRRRSRSRSISPAAKTASVLSRKIKSSVSPQGRKALRSAKPASHSITPRTPLASPRNCLPEGKRNLGNGSELKSTPRLKSGNDKKLRAGSPGLSDVTNVPKAFNLPKLIITKSSPVPTSCEKRNGINVADDNSTEFEQCGVRNNKYFYTPGKSPTVGKVRPRKKYFETPKNNPNQNKVFATSPGSYRVNYNTVQSPIALYIRGTDPNLITNVKGKTNERMLTPRAKTPNSRSKVSSPILARSPCLSPQSTETTGLKFSLTPVRKNKQKQDNDVLNIALCESNPSSSVGSESTSISPFPEIFYKPAPCVKMVENELLQRRGPRCLVQGTNQKIIYRHEGRVKLVADPKTRNVRTAESTKASLSSDLADISLVHQRPAAKTNYLLKK